MSEVDDLLFDEVDAIVPDDDADTLTIDIDGWEGPLDLLLTLARNQKVDLRQISILQLVEQYLGFIENARALKLELAADYLVMAAWLTYLKSALLLPKDPAIDPSPEELALRLQLRLERLNSMRESGARLMARDRIGRDIFLYESVSAEEFASWPAEERHGQEDRRRQIDKIKVRLEDSGGVSPTDVMKEFKETTERDEFLARELVDLEKYKLDEERTRELVRLFAEDKSVRKILIEPHLKSRLKLGQYDKIRFQGCKAARHDDHIHVIW